MGTRKSLNPCQKVLVGAKVCPRCYLSSHISVLTVTLSAVVHGLAAHPLERDLDFRCARLRGYRFELNGRKLALFRLGTSRIA